MLGVMRRIAMVSEILDRTSDHILEEVKVQRMSPYDRINRRLQLAGKDPTKRRHVSI